MADDVKVKFGGDFSEIDKDAQSASKKIGTALGGWIGDYSSSIKKKLIDSFSMENIVGKFFSMINDQLQKFKEIDTLSRKLNISREELQKFSKIGKEFNLDMETMGRAISFANKTLGASATGNKEAQKKLSELGFSQKELNSQHIKATDVLFKLSEEYEKNVKIKGKDAASNILAIHTANSFGRAGSDLIPIIKEGNEELKKRIDLMSVYSESEVKAGAAAARTAEKMQARFQKTVVGRVIGGSASIAEDFEVFGGGGEGGIMGEALKKSGFESRSDVKTLKDAQKLSENLAKLAAKEELSPEDLVRIIEAHKESSWFLTDKNREVLDNLQMFVSTMARNLDQEQRRLNKKNSEAPNNITALSASSLQQIGGGDVSSVLAGSTTQSIADNTERTANAVEKIANEGTQPQPPASVAK